MPVSMAGSRHICATCGRQYQRSAHLRRHESTHIEATRHKCPYCEKAFSRRDVCRKHAVHCPNKPDHEAIPNLKRGQKPRACDACFQSKQSCDTSDPCERCVSRNLSCTYRRREDAADVSTPSSLSTTASTTPANHDSGRTKITVAFLLGLTNPNSETILEFLASDAAARTEGDGVDISMRPTASMPISSNMFLDQDFAFLPYGFASTFTSEFLDFQSVEGLPGTSAVLNPPTSPFDPAKLKSRAAAIVSELHELHNTLTTSDPWYDGSFDAATANSVFSPENLCMFAAAFFRVSHIDFAIVHKPDFGSDRTTKPLLLAVGIAGAIRSPPSDDVIAARGFLNLSEEYIFRRLAAFIPHASTPEYTPELGENLQAALIMHSIQFFRNDVATRRKTRTQRLPALVSAVRCLGLAQTRHAPVFQYEEFVRNESRIRLAHWMALADWQQSCLFHVPPHITPAEITCDLPCPLELWDAEDAKSYFEVAQAQEIDPARRIVSFKQCVDALMSETWHGMGSFPFQNVNPTDLQLLILGINSIVISSNLMGLLGPSAQTILRAISRWELMWDTLRSRMDPVAFEKSGMSRYNSELCWAAKKFISVAVSGDRSSAYVQKVGHDSLVELHEFVRQYRDI